MTESREPIGPQGGTIRIGGGTIDLQIAGDTKRLGPPVIERWVRIAARAVTHYFGRYPVAKVTVHIDLSGHGRVEEGLTQGGDRIHVRIGDHAMEADLNDDWVMTHEMFHLGFPDTADEHHWMNEGLSVYLEPLARARIGAISEEEVWSGLVHDSPQGLPQAGDQGLDKTPTWGRTYWGGTLFWLMADIDIRKQTDGRKSLDDSIKAILSTGGDGSQEWQVEKIIEVGDRATGTHVLRDTYALYAKKPTTIDLPALWKKMGIVSEGRDKVTFDDTAPLAAIRKAMTAR